MYIANIVAELLDDSVLAHGVGKACENTENYIQIEV